MEVPPWTHDREELPGLAPVFFHRRYEGDRLESVRTWHMGDERLRAQDVRFDEEGRVRSEAEGVAERMINPWETRKLRYEYDEAGIVTSQVQSYEGVDERRTDYGHDDAGELTCLSRPRPAGDEDQGNACEGQAEGVLHRFEYDDRGRVTAYDPPDVPGAAAAGEVCGVGPEAAGEEWDRQVIAYEADGRTECTGQAGGAEVTFDWRNQRWPQEVVLGGRTTGSVRFSRDRLYPGMPIKEVRRSNEGWPADLVVEHYYAGPQLAVLRWADAPDRAGTTPIGFVQLGHEPGGFGARGVGVSGGLATCHERDADNLVASVWLGDEVPSLLDAVAPPRPDARRTVTEELGCDAGAEVPRTMQIEHRHAAGLVTGTELGEVSTTLAHDEFGGLVEQVAARSDGVTLYSAVLDRDDRGRIQCRTEEVLEDGGEVGRETCYGYDRAGRLAWVQEGGDAGRWVYEYDANGNRLREGAEGDGGVLESPMEYQVDDQDRLLLRGGIRYVWTPDGSLCRKIPPVDGVEPVEEQAGCDGEAIPGETRYLYDALGNLLRVDLPGGHRVEYRVDGMNRRVVRGSHEWQGGRLVDERLAYVYADKLNPMGLYVEGRDPDGEPTWRLWQQYVYATRDNVPDLMLKDGRVYRIVADHLGSVRLVVDVDSGVVAQRLRYDAFGRVLEDTDPGFQPFGFAGGLYDRMTGLVRFGARDYDPEVGRWTAKDPIGFEGGDVNLFGYVFGDPLNGVDSSGLDVYKCEAVADVPFNPLRWTHAWIKTDTVEAGMGPADGGIPGVDGRSDSPYATTGVADHTGEAAKRSAICRKVSDVDEWRVNRALRLERRLGRWTPWNQCHSFVDSVLRKARRSAPPETPWWTMLLRR